MYVIDLKTPYESYAIRFWSKVIWGHRVKNKVKFQTNSNDKSNSVNVLALDKHQKKYTVTYLSDLWLRVEGQRKVKSQTTSNSKSKSVNILTLDRHPKLSTVTSLSDLRLRGQRSIALKWCQNPHRLLFHDFVIEIKNDYMV